MAKKKISSRVLTTMRWQAANIKQIKFNLHHEKDSDIIEKLESVGNKQGYIKELIRADIAKEEK